MTIPTYRGNKTSSGINKARLIKLKGTTVSGRMGNIYFRPNSSLKTFVLKLFYKPFLKRSTGKYMFNKVINLRLTPTSIGQLK